MSTIAARPVAAAFRMASATPAERMGMNDTGRIEAGMLAHLSGWHADYTPEGALAEL